MLSDINDLTFNFSSLFKSKSLGSGIKVTSYLPDNFLQTSSAGTLTVTLVPN